MAAQQVCLQILVKRSRQGLRELVIVHNFTSAFMAGWTLPMQVEHSTSTPRPVTIRVPQSSVLLWSSSLHVTGTYSSVRSDGHLAFHVPPTPVTSGRSADMAPVASNAVTGTVCDRHCTMWAASIKCQGVLLSLRDCRADQHHARHRYGHSTRRWFAPLLCAAPTAPPAHQWHLDIHLELDRLGRCAQSSWQP